MMLSEDSQKLRGFIQAGGRSQRMGTDKAWIAVNHRPMIEWVMIAAQPVCVSLSIVLSADVTRENRKQYEALAGRFNAEIIIDDYDHRGPLGGIEASLKSCAADASALILACDLPFITMEFLQLLAQVHHSARSQLTIPLNATAQLQMLAGIYSPLCLDAVQTMLCWNELKTDRLCLRCKTHIVSFQQYAQMNHAERILSNLNTPDDLQSI
jgi:molybdopterin-guanine dinucleotide biosynthesis protein A